MGRVFRNLNLLATLACLYSCSRHYNERKAPENSSFDSKQRSVDSIQGESRNAECGSNANTGLSLGTTNSCSGRPVDDGEGVPGYLTDPKFLALEISSELGTSASDGKISGKIGSVQAASQIDTKATKILVVAFQIPFQELAEVLSRNGKSMELMPSQFSAVYAFEDGAFAISGKISKEQPLFVAIASKVSKDGKVAINGMPRQMAYQEKVKDGGEFSWPKKTILAANEDYVQNGLISAGNGVSCVILQGTAKCWGLNNYGQLGNGELQSNFFAAKQVVGLSSGVTKITAGSDYHLCAVQNGAAKCWGDGHYGQLGDSVLGETSFGINRPMSPFGLSSGVTDISVGRRQTCAVVNGAAKCWGCGNSVGQLGLGSVVEDSSMIPAQVVGLDSGVTAISSGYSHSCAIVKGAAKCWGDNIQGALGTGRSTGPEPRPVQVLGLESGVTAISASPFASFTCAVVNGAAKCWGYNGSRQLGSEEATTDGTPTQVKGLTSGVTAITTGTLHACAIVDGVAKCWGGAAEGALGIGEMPAVSTMPPTQASPGGAVVTAIAAGAFHTCAIMNAATYCWGNGEHGELGMPRQESIQVYSPLLVPGL